MPSRSELLSVSKEFRWNEDDRKVFKEVISMLYQSGYDPRGLVSLIQIYQANISSSPFEQSFTKLQICCCVKQVPFEHVNTHSVEGHNSLVILISSRPISANGLSPAIPSNNNT
jgi:hypothetical protein